jgi:ABC-type lipoprotein release transport system permease subunit
MLESALLIGVGVVCGIVLMAVTLLPFTNGLSLGFLSAGSEMAGGGGVLYPQLDPVDTLVYATIVWVLGVLTTLWPARTAARTPPVVAMAAN